MLHDVVYQNYNICNLEKWKEKLAKTHVSFTLVVSLFNKSKMKRKEVKIGAK
jgi:hypothetical protein